MNSSFGNVLCKTIVICVRCDSKVRFMRSGMELENRPAKCEVKNIGPHRASYQWDRLMQPHKSESSLLVKTDGLFHF